MGVSYGIVAWTWEVFMMTKYCAHGANKVSEKLYLKDQLSSQKHNNT